MKKAIIILALMLTGCTQLTDRANDFNKDDSRFGTEVVSDNSVDYIILVCDSELHVEYMFIKNGYGAGLTVRYNALGIPKECDY